MLLMSSTVESSSWNQFHLSAINRCVLLGASTSQCKCLKFGVNKDRFLCHVSNICISNQLVHSLRYHCHVDHIQGYVVITLNKTWVDTSTKLVWLMSVSGWVQIYFCIKQQKCRTDYFKDETSGVGKWQHSALSWRACYCRIRNTGRIRQYIITDACKTWVRALVTFRLDYGNVLLCDLPSTLMEHLQWVQNSSLANDLYT